MFTLNLVNKLTKTRRSIYLECVRNFGTGKKMMQRTPRNIKNCVIIETEHVSTTSENTEPKAKTDTSFMWFDTKAPSKIISIFNFKDWWQDKLYQTILEEQKYDSERIKVLGSNLNAAHFVLRWKGKVKFKQSDWLQSTPDKPVSLPIAYNTNYILTGIDASNTFITYNGLENMALLMHLNWLSFKGCKFINDWCIDKITSQFPNLEYLDISDIPNVTERGLEALYKLYKLKTLIVTNHHKSAAFELTCFMLEDCNPDLKCEILNSRYSDAAQELEAKK